MSAAEAALRELLRLKGLKDQAQQLDAKEPRSLADAVVAWALMDEHDRLKDAAWAAARAALQGATDEHVLPRERTASAS